MNSPSENGAVERHAPNTTIEKVRLDHPGDLLAAVPYLLGFHPNDSIVVVALAHGQVALTIRVDVAAVEHADVWVRLAPALSEAVTDALIVIAYGDAAAEGTALAFAGDSPWPVLDVLRANEGRWWSLGHPDDHTAGPSGRPYVPDPAVTVPLAVCAGAPAASRDDLAGSLRPGPAAAVDEVATLLPLDSEPARSVLVQAIATAHRERGDGPVPLDPARTALLLHAVSVIPVRDGCCAWHDDAAWWLWTDLIRTAPPGWIAPVATLLAVTAYQRGNSVLAQLAATHALADDPGYRLALLVDGMVTAQIHPAVVRDAIDYAVREAAALHQRGEEPADEIEKDPPDSDPASAGPHVTHATDTTEGGHHE
jgi:hypothetical protein